MLRPSLVSIAALVIAGCASEPPVPAAQAGKPGTQVADATGDRKLVCASEAPTGSALRANHCHLEQTDEERQRSLNNFNRSLNGSEGPIKLDN